MKKMTDITSPSSSKSTNFTDMMIEMSTNNALQPMLFRKLLLCSHYSGWVLHLTVIYRVLIHPSFPTPSIKTFPLDIQGEHWQNSTLTFNYTHVSVILASASACAQHDIDGLLNITIYSLCVYLICGEMITDLVMTGNTLNYSAHL